MTNKTAADWSNYWSGRAGEVAGAALVGAGIESDAELTDFWQAVFSDMSDEARVLDLACGAGSALKHAAAAGLTRLAGADISAEALLALKSAVPGAVTSECSASDTPFEDAMFDVIVSQFGLEYAGLQAAAGEVARLLAPGGKFVAVTHLMGGAIEAEVAQRLADANAVIDTNFIPLAREVFITARNPRTDENMALARAAGAAFAPAEQAMAKLSLEQGGLAAHLYGGAKQMYERVLNYELSDILGWLDGMQAEINAYRGRMASMIDAAASDESVRLALDVLAAAGCDVQPPERLQIDGEDAAWVLRAAKR